MPEPNLPNFASERRATRCAKEARAILQAAGCFDRGSRIYALINTLESTALSAETEVNDLRRALSTSHVCAACGQSPPDGTPCGCFSTQPRAMTDEH